MHDMTELKANLGLVLRGDIVVLRLFMDDLEKLLNKRPDVQIVHKHVSASKLWIREGEEMNEEHGRES